MKKIKIYAEQGTMIPEYQTVDSAAVDLHSNVMTPIKLNQFDRALIGTGLFMEVPRGYRGEIDSRSGLAYKHGVIVLNAPGVVDSDYRNEVGVLLINLDKRPFYVNKGDRIAQMTFTKKVKVRFSIVDSLKKLSKTARGLGGWGSTGLNNK